MTSQPGKFCFVKHATYPGNVRTRKEARALAQAGHLVDVICLKKQPDQPAREVVDGVNVYRVPLQHQRKGIAYYLYEYLLSFLLFTWMVTFLHLHRRYDVIQFSNMPDFLIFSTLIPKLLGARIVFNLHECMPEIYQVKYKIGEQHPANKALQRIEQAAIAYADYLITCNEEMKRIFVGRGAPADRFAIFLNTPNEDMFRPMPQQKNDPKTFTLVTHGAIETRYGHDVAIRAMPLLREQIPGIRLEIFGNGSAREQFARLSKQLGVDDVVNFRGFVPLEELTQALNNADVGVIPMMQPPAMRWVHTNKMFDYIALGKPVVITRTKAVQEYFDDASLMYFNTDDPQDMARAVLELYHNPQQRQDMVRNASQVYDHNKWSVQAATYCGLMEHLADRARATTAAAHVHR